MGCLEAMQTVNPSMKYAIFSCLYPVVGCYMFGTDVRHASSQLILLFPIPVVLFCVALGLHYAWHNRTRERIDKFVRGNMVLMVVFVVCAIIVQVYERQPHK